MKSLIAAITNKRRLKKVMLVSGISLSLLIAGCQKQTAEDHIQAAQAFIQEGDEQAAIVELKNALQLDPNVADARFELGKLYLNNEVYEAAEKELSRAIELGKNENDVIPYLSKAFQRTGTNAALIEIEHDNSSLTSVQQIEIGFYKLQALIQLEKRAEARSLIDELMQIDTTSVYKGLVDTISAVLREDFETALNKAVELQKQAPLNKDVLGMTARLYLLNEQPENAADVYADYVLASPEDVEIRFTLANLLVEQGRTEEAEPHVDKLLAINEQNGLLNQLKGIIRAAEDDYENAQKFSELAIQNGRADPVVRLIAGFAAFEQGKFEDAERHMGQIATLLPDNHPGLRILAASQLQTGKVQEASEVLNRLDNLASQDATLFSQAGYDLLRTGDRTSAASLIEKAEGLSETTDDLTRLGVLKLSLNNIDGIIDLEKAVEKTPESVSANTTLATAYLATDQLDKAFELAKQWQATDPQNIDALLLEGNVQQRKGDMGKAKELYNQALSLEPNNPKAELAMIGLDILDQQVSSAATKLSSFVKKHPNDMAGLLVNYSVQKELGDIERGIQPIVTAANADGQNKELSLLLARVFANENRFSEAKSAIGNIASDIAAPLAYWPLKGGLLIRSNELAEAEAHYEAWLDLYPNQKDAVIGKAVILEIQNKNQEALELTSNYLKTQDDLQVSLMQAYFFAVTGEAEAAQKVIDSLDESIQPLPFLRGVAARIALLENRPKDAIDDALIAYEANPTSKNMLLVVQAQDSSGLSNQSYDFLAEHIKANPTDLRALMIKGEKQINRDVTAAIETYQAALEVNPNNFIVLNNLAYILMEEGEIETAAGLAQRAYELRPDNVATVDTYAQILVKQNKFDAAVEAYQKVRASNTDNEEIYLNFVEALLLNGNNVVAKRRLEERTFVQLESNERVAVLKQKYSI